MDNVLSQEQVEQQKVIIQQLKDLLRENEKRFQDKEKELQENTSKFQKFKLQSKAKISHLTSQLKEQEKPLKKDDCDFDDTSSSDSSDQSRRGKVIFLKKQLEQTKQKAEKKEEEIRNLNKQYERRLNDLETQLSEKNLIISTFADKHFQEKDAEDSVPNKPAKDSSSVQEMYAQIVYKDSKILELNNQILEHEKKIMDLQEHIREKNEVLQQRNRAVQLLADDMNRKGQTVIHELDETKDQMKIMQENFSTVEVNWKKEFDALNLRIKQLEEDIMVRDQKIKTSDEVAKNLESARYELSTKNAELQKKIILIQEGAAKQCELYHKEVEDEMNSLKESLQSEKYEAAELKRNLSEINSQSENKVLKARVKERTKFKTLERELSSLKKANEEKPKELIQLQQHVAELEEEKGSLQLRLMDIEEQINLQDKLKKENDDLQNAATLALEKIQSLEREISELNAEKLNCQSVSDSLHGELNHLQDIFNHTNEEKCELSKKLLELNVVRESLESNYLNLKEENTKTTNLYDEAYQKLEILKDEKVTSELKVIELEEMRESDEKIKNELRAKLKQLKQSLDNENNPVFHLEKEKLELEAKLQHITDLHKSSKDETKELFKQIDSFKQKLDRKEGECNEASEANVKFKEENSTFLNKLKDSEEQYCKLHKDFEEKMLQNLENEKQLKLLQHNISSLQHELLDVFATISATSIDDYHNKWKEIMNTIQNLNNNYSQIVQEKEELENNLHGKEAQIEKCNQTIEQQNHTFKICEDDLKECVTIQEGKISQLENLIVEKDGAIKKLQSTILEKDECVQALSNNVENQSQTLIEVEKEKDILYKEIKNLKNLKTVESEKVQSKMSSLLDQIADLELELSRLHGEAESKLNMIQNLQDKIMQLQLENKSHVEAFQESEKKFHHEAAKVEEYIYSIEAFKGMLFNVKKENEELMDKVAKKDTEMSILNENMARLEEMIHSNKQEISAASEKLFSSETTIAVKEEQLIKLKEQNKMLEQEMSHSSLSLSEKEELYKTNLEEKLLLEAELAKLKLEVESLTTNLTGLNTEYSSLNAANTQLKDHLQKCQSELCMLKTQLDEKHMELQNIKQCSENQLFKLQTNEKCIHDLTDGNERLKETVADQNEIIKEMTEKGEILSDDYHRALHTSDNYKQEMHNLMEKLETLQYEVESTRSTKDELDKNKSHLETQFNSLNAETTSLKVEVQSHLQQVADLSAELNKCQEEELRMKSEMAELRQKNEALSDQNQSLQDGLVNVQESEKRLQSAFLQESELQKEAISKLTEQLSRYEAEISALHSDVKMSTQNSSKEKTILDCKLQDAVHKSDVLEMSINDLNTSLQVSAQEKQKMINENIQLVTSVREYEQLIEKLKSQMLEAEEKSLNVQFKLEQKIVEHESSNHTALKDLECLKGRYCALLKCIRSAYYNEADTTCFDSENTESISLDKLVNETEKVMENVTTHVLDFETKVKNMHSEIREHIIENEALVSQYNTLKTDYNTMQLENCSLKSENEKIRDLISNLSLTILESSKQYDLMHENVFSELQSKEKMVEAMQSNILGVKQIVILQKGEIISLKTEKNNTLADIGNLKTFVCKCEQKIEDLAKQNTELISQHDDLNSQLCRANENISFLQSSCSDNVKEMSEKLDISYSELQLLQQELNDKKSKLLSTEEKVSVLEEKCSDLQLCMNQTSNHISDLKFEMKKKDTEILSKVEEIDFLTIEITKLRLSHKDLIENNSAMQLELDVRTQGLQNFEDKVLGLNVIINEKDEAISKLNRDKENNSNALMCSQMALEKADSSILNLQNEVTSLKRQRNEHLELLQTIETSNNVSNILQVEVEDLQRELSRCEEQKNSLQQHLENVNSQINTSMQEKEILENNITQMEHELNNLIENNKNISNSLEETKSMLCKKEMECQLMENQNIEHLKNYDSVFKELENLKLEQEKRISEKASFVKKEVYDSIANNFMDLQNTHEKLKFIIKDIKDNVLSINLSNDDGSDIKFFPKTYDLNEESFKMVISDFQDAIFNVTKLRDKNETDLKNALEDTTSQNQYLLQELDKLKQLLRNDDKVIGTNEKLDKIQEVKYVAPVSCDIPKLNEEHLQQSSPSSETSVNIENESLKQELHNTKVRCAKMLTKLKLFKDKTEKLQNEIKELRQDNDRLSSSLKVNEELEERLSLIHETHSKLSQNFKILQQEKVSEFVKSNNKLSEIKQRNTLIEDECARVRKELQDYKHSWEQSNVSFELQKEDNERLSAKIMQFTEVVESLKAELVDYQSRFTKAEKEIVHLRQELQNMREHANMLLSDNETYQNLTEKLKAVKIALEQRLLETKEKHTVEIQNMEKRLQLELKRDVTEREIPGEKKTVVSHIEKEYLSLKDVCNELQRSNNVLQQELEVHQKEIKASQQDKLYMQQQLLEKVSEIKNLKLNSTGFIKNSVDEAVQATDTVVHETNIEKQNPFPYLHSDSTHSMEIKITELNDENKTLKSELNSLTQELHFMNKRFELLNQENISKESMFEEELQKLQEQVKILQASATKQVTALEANDFSKKEIMNAQNLEIELQQAMSSLHRQGLRCEELSLEVSKLLEERNCLRWKLHQYQQQTVDTRKKLKDVDTTVISNVHEHVSVQIENPVQQTKISSGDVHAEVAILHERLIESEKTCQELRRVNDALDQALINERNQKTTIEEELGYAKEHILQNVQSSNDEYQILLGDIDEPEMFAETNFSVSRSVKTHAYKIRRWLRGRRNFLCRTVKSRNYSQLLYLFYICVIHIWLLICIFG